MKLRALALLVVILPLSGNIFSQENNIQPDYSKSLEAVWDKKKVLESKIIDGAETLDKWEYGALAKAELSSEIVKSGTSSIKVTTPVVDNSKTYPIAYIERMFDGANLEKYNRVAVWIYAEQANNEFFYVSIELKNRGKIKVPNRIGISGKHYVKLETGKWNRVYWEIPSIPRDKVHSIAFVATLKGKAFKGIGNTLSFYIDDFEFQNVNTDYDEGWKVAPNKIAYSHNGYKLDLEKTAMVSGVKAKTFKVLNADNNKVVLEKNIKKEKTRFGKFQKLDFSEIKEPGNYLISVGNIQSKPFRIGNNIWKQSILNNLNFFKAERCGQTVEGIHGNCHGDVICEHNGEKVVVNGGWHDAGDLTQMVYNTGDAVVTMLQLAKKVEGKDNDIYNALVEEAKWGIDWMLKTRFSDGYRHNFGALSKYTDGIIGTDDDVSFKAKNQPYENFLSSMVLSESALFFKESNKVLYQQCMDAAIEDYNFAVEKITILNVELCGNATIAALNLYKLTNNEIYKQNAFKWAEVLMDSQQKEMPNWKIPLRGFFYKTPKHLQILRYNPIGMDQAPILALNSLCETFQKDTSYKKWYSTVKLYVEYVKKSSELANPYQMIPSSIYNIDEVHKPSVYGLQQSTLAKYADQEEKNPQYLGQVKSGLKLGEGNYLRSFPVWYSHRGSAGIQMSQAKALAVGSKLIGDAEGLNLAAKQLEWMVGYNPFAQSTVYGEGYDFPPMYFASSGPLVGALACGVQTLGNTDVPYWPASACFTYKEIWTNTTSRYLWLISEFISE